MRAKPILILCTAACLAVGSACPPAQGDVATSSAVIGSGVPLQPAPPPISPETFPAGPAKPTAPTAIPQPTVTDAFHCERKFLYKGKVYDCDSYVERDAERLRPLMKGVPGALADLDTYQRNRQNVRDAAYVGSVGLFALIGGLLASRTFTDANGNLTNTGTQVRSYTAIGGVSLLSLSLIYGWFTLHKNESYVDDAIKLHNEAHPGSPITLQQQTSPGIHF